MSHEKKKTKKKAKKAVREYAVSLMDREAPGRNVSVTVIAADYASAANQALAEHPGYVLHPRSEANEALARKTGYEWTDNEFCEAVFGKKKK